MKRWVLLLLACATAAADPPAPKKTLSDNRFLFILSTSSTMKRCRAAAEACVVDLISNGAQGRMRAGDTFGVWTFDKSLHAGEFPMQIWTPDSSTALARKARDFLAKKSYGSKTRFASVAGPLASVARSSPSLMVFLIIDGGEPVKGTPFDRVLNEAIAKNYKALKERRLPFVVVLGVEEGQYTDIKLNSTVHIILPETARIDAQSAPATNHPASAPERASQITGAEPAAPPRLVAESEPAAPANDQTTNTLAIQKDPSPAPLPAPPEKEPKPASVPSVETPPPSSPQSGPPPSAPAAADASGTNSPTQPARATSPAEKTISTGSGGLIASNEPPVKPTRPATLAQVSTPPAARNPTEHPAILLWAAFGFLFAAVSLVWLLLRGPKRGAGPSLISRSVEKSKKDF